ncbi:MAG: outer membrane protein assembly factor BamA [Gemmatimonadota bacterium]|nr:outer membrane protein assembly factor BamA [Gemmatimonadota bacterium]
MRRSLFAVLGTIVMVPNVFAQEPTVVGQEVAPTTITIDSIAVEGLRRLARETVLSVTDIPLRQPLGFRDLQRAMSALYRTKQFDDVRFEQARTDAGEVLRITVVERPLLTGWSIRGVKNVSERKVRGKVRLLAGRPFDRADAALSRAAIDSVYMDEGYYLTNVILRELPQPDGSLQVVFEIDEGRRVIVSEVVVEGNEQFTDAEIVGKISSKPEGFWWWRSGSFSDDKLQDDVRDRLPRFYAARGFIDFQVLDDTLIVDENTGKGRLVLRVREGQQYEVGNFDIVGNRYFATSQLERYYPFGSRSGGFLGLGGRRDGPAVFDQETWDEATGEVRNLYMNNGYIYAQIAGAMSRRATADGRDVVDLRWQIVERQPAIVNKVIIRGNSVTHEDVIRRAIIIVPGDVMRQDALIRSYQNVSNLGFFEQPLPVPTTEPANQQGDVNVVFNVEERHTGNINFGASVGQGTGLGGFIGLDEPNLFGRAKRVSVQWQFGRNINNINLTYTDPALRGSLTSATLSLHNSRLRYTVADLGRITSRGGSIQIGFPLRGSRYTRLFASYAIEQSDYDSPTLTSRFLCANCVLSMASLTLARDTRIGLPFATGGVLHRLTAAQGGGPLGGSGNFRRLTFEGRWYAPLAVLGGQDQLGGGMTLLMGLGVQTGFVWGDAGPHFRQLFSMGGTQFGIPLRGYEEFSITPQGFDPFSSGQQASTVDAFGASYLALTGEIGLRVSQAIYLSTFVDAGNVWDSPSRFNPSRLFRGAGVGVSLVTPLGPIGIDYAYGFDKVDIFGNPQPGWKFHFKLGQFF